MFIAGLLGKYVMVSIQSFLRELREIIHTFDGACVKTEIKLQHSNLAHLVLIVQNGRQFPELIHLGSYFLL